MQGGEYLDDCFCGLRAGQHTSLHKSSHATSRVFTKRPASVSPGAAPCGLQPQSKTRQVDPGLCSIEAERRPGNLRTVSWYPRQPVLRERCYVLEYQAALAVLPDLLACLSLGLSR